MGGTACATSLHVSSRGSRSDIDVARRHIAAYNCRDLAMLRALSDPELVLDWSASSWLEAGVYRGIDAVVGFYEGYFEAFEQIVIEPIDVTVAGGVVVVPNRARLRGRDGIEVLARSTLEFSFRGGKVVGIRLVASAGTGASRRARSRAGAGHAHRERHVV